MTTESLSQVGWKPWVLTIRPKTLTAGFVPVYAGSLLAYSEKGSISWALVFFSWLVAFFVQTASHLINDAFDLKKGADRDRVGPIRLTHLGILSFRQAYWSGIFCLLGAFLAGIPLMAQGGLLVFFLIVASLMSAYCYTGGPYPFAYTGVSEVFVLIFYGWVASGAVFYVLTGHYGWAPFLMGFQIGLLCNLILAVTNMRDIETDTKVNKRTMAVRFGHTFSKWEIAVTALVPFLLNIFWWPSWAAVLPFLALPIAIKLVHTVWKEPFNKQFLGMSALTHLLFGLLLGLGFIA